MAGRSKSVRLTNEQRVFIVTLVARFHRPNEIVAAMKETFGVEISPSLPYHYDPTAPSSKLNKGLTRLFHEVRRQFREKIDEIPIANKAYRLQEAQRLYDIDRKRENTVSAREHLEFAAKEDGDWFTNRRILATDDPAGALAKELGIDRDALLATLGGEDPG